MFGAKIRSWLDAQLARTRKKRKATAPLQEHPTARAFFFERDFTEIFPTLPISPTSFRPYQTDCTHHQHCITRTAVGATTATTNSQPSSNNNKNNAGNAKGGGGGKGNSAVNLSSPESAYSTGYSTDGTSPCATYAPEYYINVRGQQVADISRSSNCSRGTAATGRIVVADANRTTTRSNTTTTTTTNQNATGRLNEAINRPDTDRISNTGTYSVIHRRYPEYEQQWRKPAPPPMACSSPKIQSGHLPRKPYPVVQDTCYTSGYPMQLFSPRRMPLVATTSTQVMPITSSQQQRQTGRGGGLRTTNPWRGNTYETAANNNVTGRPWSRQQSYAGVEYACRQESLSVGRSPVNWYPRQQQQLQQNHHLQQQHHHHQHQQQRSSSTSSCSSRSRSCSLSSSSNSSSNRPPSSPSSSDDITLNEVMGKYDDNYLYEKETDLISEPRETINGGGSSSANFSSASASASSLDLQLDFAVGCNIERRRSRSSSRSTSGNRLTSSRGALTSTTRSRQRRSRRHSSSHRRLSLDSRESTNDDSLGDELDEREHREEVELLQEALNRRLKKNNSETSAQTSRALLERLLMKNTSVGYEAVTAATGNGGGGGGGRRAWSSVMRPAAASRSVGGTPICLRRRTSPRPPILSPLRFNRQVYPAESTSSMKNMSASELALIEADKEADLKYEQLIMEAERMLINVQQQLQRDDTSSANNSRRGSTASVTADNSPSRFPRMLYQQQQNCTIAPNKRVELIKNAELNIELALSKSRNSQPELACGSIKDLLDHSSPKRLLQQQQKKMIEPIVQSVVSTQTQTTDNEPTSLPSIDTSSCAKPTPLKAPSDESEHYSCPQSEPLKRKVYEAQDSSSRLLLQHQAATNTWLRNSDTDCAHEQTQLQSSSAASSYSQLRKQMLLETLQSLKQSLEDQSAALKLNCLRPL